MKPEQRSSQPTVDDALSDVESVIEDLKQSESAKPVFAGFQTELPQDAAQIDNASAAAQLASFKKFTWPRAISFELATCC